MNMPRNGITAGFTLLLTAVLAGCSSDQAITTPATRAPGAPSNNLVTTPTVWDFASLLPAGFPATDLGTAHTFTIAGVGSITASSDAGHHVTDKDDGGSERGLGICDATFIPCISNNDEVGTASNGGFLDLDFSALASGTTVSEITFGSVQVGEGVAFAISADGGATFGAMTNIVPNPPAPGDVFTFDFNTPLSTTGLVIRFTTAAGAAPGVDNDYTVMTVTTNQTTGKSFTIGPSSMEGAIRIDNGDWVNGGYSFKFVSAHAATTYTVTSFLTISGPCRDVGGHLTGTSDVLTVSMGTTSYSIPASSQATDWLPTGDANSVLSWEGSVIAAGLCGGGTNQLDASKGAVFHSTVSQVPPSGSLVDFRFKYRDPAAKGKPNTNCLDTTDPNRAKADVCGASWSQTVRDP